MFRSDVKLNSQAAVRSSKIEKKSDKVRYIPVVKSPQKQICVCEMLVVLFKRYPMGDQLAPLFSMDGVNPISYGVFARGFKSLLVKAGIQGNFASHSLRRGGSTYMSMKGCNVTDIRLRGGWKSDCVYKYICRPVAHDVEIDRKFVGSWFGGFGDNKYWEVPLCTPYQCSVSVRGGVGGVVYVAVTWLPGHGTYLLVTDVARRWAHNDVTVTSLDRSPPPQPFQQGWKSFRVLNCISVNYMTSDVSRD